MPNERTWFYITYCSKTFSCKVGIRYVCLFCAIQEVANAGLEEKEDDDYDELNHRSDSFKSRSDQSEFLLLFDKGAPESSPDSSKQSPSSSSSSSSSSFKSLSIARWSSSESEIPSSEDIESLFGFSKIEVPLKLVNPAFLVFSRAWTTKGTQWRWFVQPVGKPTYSVPPVLCFVSWDRRCLADEMYFSSALIEYIRQPFSKFGPEMPTNIIFNTISKIDMLTFSPWSDGTESRRLEKLSLMWSLRFLSSALWWARLSACYCWTVNYQI